MKVEQVMNRNVKTCRSSDSLDRAAQLMWENDCGCVPIVDDEGRGVGMVTDRDVCMAAYTQGGPLTHLRVEPPWRATCARAVRRIPSPRPRASCAPHRCGGCR